MRQPHPKCRCVSRHIDVWFALKYFYWASQGDASFEDHLCYFCLVFVMHSCASVYWCLYSGHLLGKGWPLGSCLWCLIVTLSLSHWYPGSGVVLDCIIPDLCPFSYFLKSHFWKCQTLSHIIYIYSCCLFLHVTFVIFSLESSCGYHLFSAMNQKVLEYSRSLDTPHCHARASSVHAGALVTD